MRTQKCFHVDSTKSDASFSPSKLFVHSWAKGEIEALLRILSTVQMVNVSYPTQTCHYVANMSFAIEVPGEAIPLSLQNLYHTLTAASSTNPQQIKSGAQQLQNWEKQPGYYSSLQSIFVDISLPVEARYLCIIQLKNGIDKYWRKTAINAISKEEKDQIRARSVESGTKEPDARLALQNALMIAKIVRYEYPIDWSRYRICLHNTINC